MRYYKFVQDGFILAIGTGDGYEEISKEEFDSLYAMIQNKPDPVDGYKWRLSADSEWVSVPLPPDPDENK